MPKKYGENINAELMQSLATLIKQIGNLKKYNCVSSNSG